MKSSKNSSPRPDATAPDTLAYSKLENRMVLNGDFGWVILSENTQLDDQGRISHQEFTFDTNHDQVADLRTIDQYQYNADGLNTNHFHQNDDGADGTVDSQYWSETGYTGNGQLLVMLEGWDNNGDGQRDNQIRSSWTYNEDNNPILLLTETDVDGDGTFDESVEQTLDSGDGSSGWSGAAEDTRFDDQGRIIFQDVTTDNDGDGIGDYRQIDEFTYSSDGRTTSHWQQVDNGVDGVIDSQYWSERVTDEAGLPLVSNEAWDQDGDGDRDSEVRSSWTYDESGRMTRSTYTQVGDGNEVPDNVETVSWTYQESGLLDTTTHEVDNNGDGVVDYRIVCTNEYDTNSMLTSTHFQVDENADGVIDLSYSAGVEWLASAGGGGGNPASGGSDDDVPVDDVTDDLAPLNAAAIGSFVPSDMSSSKKTVGDVDRSNLDGAGATNSLQLAGAINFASDGKINAARDDAFSSLGREGNDLSSEDTSLMTDGDIDRELT